MSEEAADINWDVISMDFTGLDNAFPKLEEIRSTGSYKAESGDPESDPIQEGVKAGSSRDSDDLSSDSVVNPQAPTSGKACSTGSKPNCCRDPESAPRQERVKTSSSSDSEDSFGHCGVNPRIPTSGKACMTFPKGPNTRKKTSKPEKSHTKLSKGRAKGPYCHICRLGPRVGHEHYAQCPRCGLYFCKRCLALRHGEDRFQGSKAELQWVCPKCRKGCGPGCTKCCCTCSECCHLKGIPPFGRRLIKEARSADFNLHDHVIHVQTRESKEKIANRKIAHGWIKAANGECRSSDLTFIDNKSDDHHPAAHNLGSTEKKGAAGDEPDDERITAPDNSSDSNCDRKTQEFVPSQNMFGSTSQSDGLRHCNKKKQTVPRQINRMPVDKAQANPVKSREDCGLHRSANEEVDIDTLSKDLSDSLVAFDDMAVNIYLMSIWLRREKVFEGNRMSIILSDKEVALKNAIKARSYAKPIAFEFHPARFMLRPRREQEKMKQCLTETLSSELADSRSRLHEFFEEADQLVSKTSQSAQDVVHLTMDSTTAAVEKGLDAILSRDKSDNPPALT